MLYVAIDDDPHLSYAPRPGLARRLDFLRARGHRVVPDRLGRSMSAAMTTPSPSAVYLLATLHRRAIRPLGVGASVGAYCSRRPGIDRYWAPATAPDCVLRQHGARGADTQRNAPPLVTEKADPLGEGPTWQDLLATHPAMPDLKRRIRLFDLPTGSSSEAREETQFTAKRELALTRGIKHDGVVGPLEYVETDSGPALVFDHDSDARPWTNTSRTPQRR